MTLQQIIDDLNELIQKRLEEGDASTLLGRPYFLLSRVQELLCNTAEARAAKSKYGIGTYCYMKVEGSPIIELDVSTTDENPHYILKSRSNSFSKDVFTIKRKKCKHIGKSGVYGLVPDRVILNRSFAPGMSVDEFYHWIAQIFASNNQYLLQAIQCIDNYANELGQDRLNELNQAFCLVRESTQLSTLLPKTYSGTQDIMWKESIFNPDLRAKALALLNKTEKN
ncbi:hypothetical protein [Flavonifractor sp. An306]|uniref:hypothetical protein n=1 Tax=Flavonifractor sp. An306 TaxID=1965629 RepID=UPI00174A5A72|nr:hypothetical protein [Flavonifractor sp. An306]